MTAVEWLVEKLNKSIGLTKFVDTCDEDYKQEILGIINQALEMEKKSICIDKAKKFYDYFSYNPLFDYIKCPLHRYTFQVKNIREWTENNCEGKTLNLFAGRTKLNIEEVRNDLDPEALTDYNMDAVEFLRTWQGEKFDTVLLDPPYAFRKSMEMYKGIKCSPFKQMKDEIKNVLKEGGKVITFGYHSNTMGAGRGFKVEKIALFSHGGAIHDTIASVERHCL